MLNLGLADEQSAKALEDLSRLVDGALESAMTSMGSLCEAQLQAVMNARLESIGNLRTRIAELESRLAIVQAAIRYDGSGDAMKTSPNKGKQ